MQNFLERTKSQRKQVCTIFRTLEAIEIMLFYGNNTQRHLITILQTTYKLFYKLHISFNFKRKIKGTEIKKKYLASNVTVFWPIISMIFFHVLQYATPFCEQQRCLQFWSVGYFEAKRLAQGSFFNYVEPLLGHY